MNVIPSISKVLLLTTLCILGISVSAKPNIAYDQIILKTAVKEGVDPAFVHAVIRAESNYDALAVSHAGAEGLMQLIPATANRFKVKNSFVPEQNIMGGTKYLRWLLKRFNGDMRLTLAGYNAGEGAVDRYNGIPPYKETQKYVKKVLRFYREYKGLPPLLNNQLRLANKTNKNLVKHRADKQVNTSGLFHRVSSLTVSSSQQPMNGYSRIRARSL